MLSTTLSCPPGKLAVVHSVQLYQGDPSACVDNVLNLSQASYCGCRPDYVAALAPCVDSECEQMGCIEAAYMCRFAAVHLLDTFDDLFKNCRS